MTSRAHDVRWEGCGALLSKTQEGYFLDPRAGLTNRQVRRLRCRTRPHGARGARSMSCTDRPPTRAMSPPMNNTRDFGFLGSWQNYGPIVILQPPHTTSPGTSEGDRGPHKTALMSNKWCDITHAAQMDVAVQRGRDFNGSIRRSIVAHAWARLGPSRVIKRRRRRFTTSGPFAIRLEMLVGRGSYVWSVYEMRLGALGGRGIGCALAGAFVARQRCAGPVGVGKHRSRSAAGQCLTTHLRAAVLGHQSDISAGCMATARTPCHTPTSSYARAHS